MTATLNGTRATRGLISPSLEDVAAWLPTCAEPPRLIPISREIIADTETPVSAFVKIAAGGQGFILESVEGGERIARYSFIGTAPRADLTLRDGMMDRAAGPDVERTPYHDPLTALEETLAPLRSQALPGSRLPRFLGGAVGYLAFEAVRAFEPRVGAAKGAGLGLPDGRFMIVDDLLVFDHVERTIKAVAHIDLDPAVSLAEAYDAAAQRVDALVRLLRAPLPAMPVGQPALATPTVDRCRPNTTPERFHDMVERAKELIGAGDVFQVVLSQRVDVDTPAHPFTIYRALRTINPSPYMFYLDFGDHQIVGASPELLVRLEDGVVTNHPIAGTRPRGATPEEDALLVEELLADPKERAEHIMLVDLGRNDIGRVSAPGSVRVPTLMSVEKFSHVMHIVSNVEGDLAPGLDGFDALRSCFPAGTVSGAPKVRAMEIITELETDRRGAYSGAVGYIDFSGDMDTCIALRTLVVKDGVASMQAGGGIVFDSTPEGEYAESHHKMRALLRAIELAESIDASAHDQAEGVSA